MRRLAALLILLAAAGCCAPPPATTVVLRGTVRFAGPMPKLRPYTLTDDIPGVPKEGIPREDLVVDAHGGVRWALVYVRKGVEGRAFEGPPVRMEISGFRYRPHVVGVQVGQTLEIHNRDQRLHHVHSVSDRNMSFGAAMPAEPWTTRFANPEVMVDLRCDIHPWMRARVGVLDHPYFAVTDAEGNFEIKNLPPGNYTLAVWHERLQPQEREIAVTDNATENFTLKER